jgi:hypothetical protein
MNFRTTAVLFGVMIFALCVLGLMLTLQQRKLDPGLVLPSLAKDQAAEITEVTVEREGHKYAFFKEGGTWRLRIDDHPPLRADGRKVDALVDELKRAGKNPDAEVTSNLSQWGLDRPREVVTLKSHLGKQWWVKVGKENPDGSTVYVTSSDHPDEVLAVPRGQVETALIKPEDINKYRALQLLTVSDATADRIDLKPAASVKGGQELILEKDKSAAWRILKPPLGPADFEGTPPDPKTTFTKDPTGVRGLINTLRDISVRSDADFEPLGKQPFPKEQAILIVEVERVPGKGKDKGGKEVLLIGPKVEQKKPAEKKAEGAEEPQAQYYARLEGDPAVARVDARNVEILLDFTRKPDSLRSHDLAQIEPGAPDVVQVSRGKDLADTITLYRKERGDWRVAAADLRHKANSDAVGDKGLLGAIQGKGKVTKFIDVKDKAEGEGIDKDLGLDEKKATARVVVWVGGLEEEKDAKAGKKDDKAGEAKKGDKKGAVKEAPPKEGAPAAGPKIKPGVKPAVTLLFGQPRGDEVPVRRQHGETVSRVWVPLSVLDKITPREGALAYLDTNISPFKEDDVEKLELRVGTGKDATVFVAEKGPKEWKLVSPEQFKGRPADRDGIDAVLRTLSKVTVERYEKKVAPKEDLSRFGLDRPAVTATVTLKKEDKKEPKTFSYAFGRKAPEEKGKAPGVFGMMTSGDLKDIVFVAPARQVEALEKAELRDRTIFTFDPSKAKEVKVSAQVGKFFIDLDFERTETTWVVKKDGAPRGFKLDPSRVRSLLLSLSNLRAVRFVSFSGPKDEQGLTNKNPPKIRIEVIMADKARHTLEIGAAEGNEGYFAQSNALPKAVFLVPQFQFSALVSDGPSFFSSNR